MIPSPASIVSEIENPHEILGLTPLERDPVVIVGAALAKLCVIRASNGSEVMVRRAVEAAVIRARDRLLRQAFSDFTDDFPETGPAVVGAGSAFGGETFRRD